MNFFFELMGDQMPSSDDVHLEPIYVHEVWTEYKTDMESVGNAWLDVSTFGKLWTACFPHVKIREHKAVGMKCNTCAILSDLRKTLKDQSSREYIKQVHAFHRSTYMGERLAYYDRRTQGEMMQKQYLSMICDGMAQHHCLLPWSANLTQLKCLPHHIQGVMLHGRRIFMYRTFHNIGNGANLQIHTLLKSLEAIFRDEHSLPDTLYVQIDGGSENTAKAVLALCELLIFKKLCKRIVLTRLIPGHTHEDIDSKFAIIWKSIRGTHIFTHTQWKKAIKNSLTTENMECHPVDILAIPNYVKYLRPHMGKVKRYAKGKWTQLQFIFESCAVDAKYFPLGVKTTYRAFSEKKVVLIRQTQAHACGLEPFEVDIKTFPEADPKTGAPAGFSVLKSVPTGILEPAQFVQGSKAMLDAVYLSIVRHFKITKPLVVQDWKDWIDNEAPKSDDSGEYCATHPLQIPFENELFGIANNNLNEPSTGAPYVSIPPSVIRYRATPGIQHRNSEKKSKTREPIEAYDTATGKAIRTGNNMHLYKYLAKPKLMTFCKLVCINYFR
jgi:hypothetical protein